jgi:hypothetical protein
MLLPCILGTSTHKLQTKTRRTATCPTAPDPASLLRRALMLPRTPRLWTPPPCSGGLLCYHMSHGSGPHLPTQEGSGTTTCHIALDHTSLLGGSDASTRHTAPDPTSLLRRAPVLSRAHDSRSCLPAREGFDSVTYPATLRETCILRIKKGLADLPMQQGSHVSKTRPYVTEASARRTDRRHYQDLQTMRVGTTAPCYSAL